ncbi:hypothetical protein EN943_15660 [Mesorhizobium sp. M7A.F.Ca.US.006.01.1.1]|uniref:hypothetical protein n=1 Tax=Mesorhizobium sp. M7A.F.Ca.US.006.01.1.1 TaxID=2496707 RepID=UPI000FCC44CA|nr:hypothetical protein [Mesorhizobium sp. M7A.F.Ca.US.006.01.1.1]RUZ76916.1 hypothetical protein EN943_15660 [Mesorhizobium sp. M7A.F.Ca.US.006.01.1.1]
MYKQTSVGSDIKAALAAHKELVGKPSVEQANGIVACSGLHGELGYLDDGVPTVYSLDEDTRDRLIVHARQDAAHALLNTISLLQLRRADRRLAVAGVLLLIYIAIRVSL